MDRKARPLTVAADQNPPIDLVHLRRYTLGNPGLEREILDLFLDQAPQTIERLNLATTDKEWRAAAHTLKGSARAVGAFALGSVAEALEHRTDWHSEAVRTAAVAATTAALTEARAFVHRRYPK